MEEETFNREVMNFEETDNWTFVNAEDIAADKAEHYCEQPEDFSDSYSDHESGSDSGSSIVVIDSHQQSQALSTSSSLTSNTTPSVELTQSNDIDEDHKKVVEVEVETQGLDEELVHLFDHQPEVADTNEEQGNGNLPAGGALDNGDQLTVDEDDENTSHNNLSVSELLFVKEGSPFEKLEMPDTVEQVKLALQTQDGETVLDYAGDSAVQHDNFKEEEEQSSLPSQSTNLDLNMAQVPVPAEKLLIDQSFHHGEEEIVVTINNSENKSASIISETVDEENTTGLSDPFISTSFQNENQEEGGIASENSANAVSISKVEDEDKEPDETLEVASNEEDDAIVAQQVPQQGDGEWASGDDSPSDDSDDETWDLSIEAFVNTGSLASSISSLILQPSSPSPSLVLANDEAAGPYPAGHVKIKPDLLEEAQRIEEFDQLDYSTVSNPDLPAELNLANIFRERHYVHHPNQRLNVQLSYVVAFAMAAVAGFALGNIVGLSDNFPSRCTFSSANKQTSNPSINEGWTEDDWQTEIQRLTEENEELQRALNMNNNPSSSRFDLQLNELLSENWDLKRSVARIRYGRPVRSIEDRANINRLQTENDDLRAAVGKLRYQCGQLKTSTSETPRVDEDSIRQKPLLPSIDSLWKTLDALNMTNEWNNAVNNHNLLTVSGQLEDLKDLAIDLMRLIGLRREELINMTRQNSSRSTQKMELTLKKSAQKVLDLMERLNNRKISLSELATDLEKRLVALRLKLDTHWKKLYQQIPETGEEHSSTTSSANTDEKSLNSDWFLSMGQQREKLRQNEENFQKQTHWIFERARNRDRTRKSHNNKKQKMFHGDNSWNQFSA